MPRFHHALRARLGIRLAAWRYPLPNFLVVGAPRCGTTSLYHMADQHPHIFMTRQKEPRFFVRDRILAVPDEDPRARELRSVSCITLPEYLAAFCGSRRYPARGEASPQYLVFHRDTVPRIRFLLGDPTIFVMLRDPVERALSNYRFLHARGVTTLDLDAIIDGEPSFVDENRPPFFRVVQMGMYHDAVEHFLSAFSHVRIFLYDDLVEEPQRVARSLYRDLGVDEGYRPRGLDRRHNATRRDRGAPGVPPSAVDRLRGIYAEDIARTAGLIGRDLSHWAQ